MNRMEEHKMTQVQVVLQFESHEEFAAWTRQYGLSVPAQTTAVMTPFVRAVAEAEIEVKPRVRRSRGPSVQERDPELEAAAAELSKPEPAPEPIPAEAFGEGAAPVKAALDGMAAEKFPEPLPPPAPAPSSPAGITDLVAKYSEKFGTIKLFEHIKKAGGRRIRDLQPPQRAALIAALTKELSA